MAFDLSSSCFRVSPSDSFLASASYFSSLLFIFVSRAIFSFRLLTYSGLLVLFSGYFDDELSEGSFDGIDIVDRFVYSSPGLARLAWDIVSSVFSPLHSYVILSCTLESLTGHFSSVGVS